MTYHALVTHYTACFEEHGINAQGVDWPNESDLITRFNVLTQGYNHLPRPLKLLDLGSGPGLYARHIARALETGDILYTGIDLSEPMIQAAKSHNLPATFLVRDIIQNPLESQSFDFAVLNGVLTIKRDLSYQHMCAFAKTLLQAAFNASKHGLIFNVMNTYVDWCRLDLFHWDLDDMLPFLQTRLSRHIHVRTDYGLFETMVHVYREPRLMGATV